MFSGNQKISGRQVFRLLTYDLLGLGTLVLPAVLAGMAGRDGIFCILAGVFAAVFYLKLLGVLVRDMNVPFSEYLNRQFGAFLGRLVQAGYLIYFILLAGYTAYLFSDIVLKNLLREESFLLVLILILILAGYGLWGGIEGRARVYEMLFWFIMIPLFFMLFSALDEIQTDYWTPVFYSEPAGVLKGSCAVFLYMALVFLILFLGGYVKKKEVLIRAGKCAVLFAGGVHAALYLILLGVFGSSALAAMDYPAITLMSTVKISGGFLKRADAFMFGIWFFTLYALLNSAVFYGGTMLRGIFTGNGKMGFGRISGRFVERVSGIFVLALAFAAAEIFYQSSGVRADYCWFACYIGTPFVILIPLLLALRLYFTGRRDGQRMEQKKEIKKPSGGSKKNAVKLAAAGAVMLGACLLSGCATAELEDRSFPIEAAADHTEDFCAEWLDQGSSGNRLLDYNHLKVMILGREFLEDGDAMNEFLGFLEKESDVPRNTYVVAAENAADILKLNEGAAGSVGTYLEDLLENVSEVDKKAYPTLGMMYQERENHLETLFIPFVAEKDGKPEIDGYYVWRRGAAAGKTDNETALLSFFTTNEMEEYTLFPSGSNYIRLFASRNEVSFLEGNPRKILVDIYCNGDTLYGAEETDKLEQQVSDYMNKTAGQALYTQGIDTADSYKKLGGYKRDWYGEYANHPERIFESEMQIEYRVHITWVNR